MLKWAFWTSAEDQEPQFPNLKRGHCYLTLEGCKAALAGWMPVGARRGAKMVGLLSEPCPPAILGFRTEESC